MDATKASNQRYVAILALVACLILIGGWLARPRDLPQNPAPVPTETELAQLARRAERRSLDNTAKYFAGVAREVESSVAYVRGSGVSGVRWDEARVVASPLTPAWGRGPVTVAAASGDTTSRPTIGGPSLPLSSITLSRGSSGWTPARRAQTLPGGGDWIVAVWRTETETAPAFAVGNFRLLSPIMCGITPVQELVSSLSFTSTMAGGGVFDIDGGLLAVVLPCRERFIAVAAASIQSILDRKDTVDQQLQDRLGLYLGPLSPEEARYFKTTDGLLVREVWSGYPADAAGIRPGDLVTAVNGALVTKIEDLSARMTPTDTALELTISRGPKRLTTTLIRTPESVPEGEPGGAGLVLEGPPKTYRIESVRPGSRAARAGIKSGDRLVQIDRAEPRNADQVKRLLDSDTQRPMWLEVIRDGRQLGVLVR